MPNPQDLTEIAREARRLSEGLGQEFTAMAIARIQSLYQPLVETLRYSRAILEAVTDGALAFDPDGKIVLANSTARHIFGLSHLVEGQSLSEVDEIAAIRGPVEHALATGESSVSHRFTLQKGDETLELDVAFHFCRESRAGRIFWLVAIIRDLTAVRDLTCQLTQASKLASLGTMLSCIIHDVNNPLANILGYAELMSADMEEHALQGQVDHQWRNRVRVILDEALRARRIIENCLAFARQSTAGRMRMDLARVIDETLVIFRTHMKHQGASLHVEHCEELPSIYGNPNLIQQVLFNIIKNALDAAGDRGSVVVRTRIQNSSALIEVVDDGTGIDPEHGSKIFSPFFTTKGERKGTGLGLSIAHTIVKEHGGELSFVSPPGQGTTFTVELPIDRRSNQRAEVLQTPVRAEPKPSKVSVLIVEDDPLMGRLISDLVHRWYGAVTEVVASIDGAVKAMKAHTYSLAFLDVRMQGIEPIDALAAIHSAAGKTPIVTLSGAERNAFVETLLRRGAAVHLRKPFSLNTLLKVMTRLVPMEGETPPGAHVAFGPVE